MKVATAVFVVFLVLKLIGIQPVSDWSWWWILSPFWTVYLAIILLGASAYAVKYIKLTLKNSSK